MKKNKFKDFLTSLAGRIVLTLVLAAIIYGIMGVAVKLDISVVSWTIYIICGIFGWQALNKITPSMFLWMSFVGWIIYFCIKGVISVIIGIFVAPYKIAKAIINLVADTSEIMTNDTEICEEPTDEHQNF